MSIYDVNFSANWNCFEVSNDGTQAETVSSGPNCGLEVHWNGSFVRVPNLHYSGGRLDHIYNIDFDRLSFFELKGMIQDDLRIENVNYMYYCILGEKLEDHIKFLVDDVDTNAIVELFKKGISVELFIEHDKKYVRKEYADLNNLGNSLFNDNSDVSYSDGCSVDEICESESESDAASLDHVSEDDDELRYIKTKVINYKRAKKKTIGNGENVECTPSEALSEGGEAMQVEQHDGYESEYAGSSDYDSPDSDNEDELTRKTDNFPSYDPKVDVFHVEHVSGMKFESPEHFKQLIKDYAVGKGYDLKFTKNNANQKIIVRCVQGCDYYVYASWTANKKEFQIKTLVDEHKCTRNFRIKIAKAKWIAGTYRDRIIKNPKWKCKELVKEIREKYAFDVTDGTAGRAKKIALGHVDNALNELYGKLWDYCAELQTKNPGSTIKLQVDRNSLAEPPVFKRMHVCFKAVRDGWIEGCRPVIGLDGCFLKSYCKGQLLSAIGRDGNNQMFPIAWAQVDVENTDNWKWFLELVMTDLGVTDGLGLTLISDQQKGLINAIADIVPMAEHRNCARHIYANFRKTYTGMQLKNLFWQASKAGSPIQFHNTMEEIKKCSEEAYIHLMEKQNPKNWSRAFYPLFSSCENVENNMCETFNGTILEAREKQIIWMMEDIRQAMMVRMQKKREAMNKWTHPICPRPRKKLQDNKMQHRFWEPIYNGNLSFEVSKGDERYAVDLIKKSCACRMWDLSGIPCPHAISAIYYRSEQPEEYVADWYLVERYKKAYTHFLQVCNGPDLWPKTNNEPPLPPKERRMPGRPKKARRKEIHAEGNKKKVSRAGMKNKCSNCGGTGHNKKTCISAPKCKVASEAKKNQDSTSWNQVVMNGGGGDAARTRATKGKQPMTNTATGTIAKKNVTKQKKVVDTSNGTSNTGNKRTSSGAIKGYGVLHRQDGSVLVNLPGSRGAKFSTRSATQSSSRASSQMTIQGSAV